MKIIRYVGYLITLISFYYLIRVILSFDFHLLTFKKNFSSLGSILLLSMGYGLFILPIGSYSWKSIIEFLSQERISEKEAFRIYARANIAKYIPGNVMQYVGRNYLASKLGWRQSDIAFSSFIEITLTIVTGFLLLFFLVIGGFVSIPAILSLRINFKLYPFYFLILMMVLLFLWFVYKKKGIPETFKELKLRNSIIFSIKIFFIYSSMFITLSFFLIHIFYFVLDIPVKTEEILPIISSFIVSWFVSFVAPGVPGGLGVRESLIVLLLSPLYGPEKSLFASLILRFVTISGDIIAFLLTFLLKKKIPLKGLKVK